MHPYGNDTYRRVDSIRKQKEMTMVQQNLKAPYNSNDCEAFRLIKCMMVFEPLNRPTGYEVLRNPFFSNTNFPPSLPLARRIRKSLTIRDDNSIMNNAVVNKMTPLHSLFLCLDNDGRDTNELLNIVQLEAQLTTTDGATDDINAKFGRDGATPLHLLLWNYKQSKLAMNEVVAIVLVLIRNGADVNAKLRGGRISLHLLCERNNIIDKSIIRKEDDLATIDLVRILIEKGADVNAKTREGKTPLHLFCEHYENENLFDVVQLLIKKGADVNAKRTDIGFTALHLLCQYYKNSNLVDLVRLLIEYGADVNAITALPRWTPLHLLCENYKNDNLIHIVKLLIEKGAKVDEESLEGVTPLYLVCQNHQSEELVNIIQLLIENGARVNIQTGIRLSPLHVLCNNYPTDKFECLNASIELLVLNGADINAKADDGSTPEVILIKRRCVIPDSIKDT